MNMVWSVRKSGLSLLTGCIGPAKPVAFIEDAAVRPAQLPDYVRGLQSIMKPLGLTASYYGHAASGLLHVRPVLDMHSAADLKKFRQVADETSALVRQFKGSLSAEHGVGIARTEYMRDQLGNQLLEVMREIKRAFDPKNVFNPGKIFEDRDIALRCPDGRSAASLPRSTIICARILLVRSSFHFSQCSRLRSKTGRSQATSSNATAAAAALNRAASCARRSSRHMMK